MDIYRIAVVNSHPIQYFAPLYAYLNKCDQLDVTALYCCDVGIRTGIDAGFKKNFKWDIDLLNGYRSIFLGERASKRALGGFWSLIVPEIWVEIRSGRYDAVIIHGYSYAAFILAFIAAKSKGLPVFIRGETHLGLKRSKLKWQLHKFVLSRFFRFINAFLAIGTANRQYYIALGVPDSKIFNVPYTIDNERFIAASQTSKEERDALRIHYGLPINGLVMIYASKFMRRKHPEDVLLAALNLQRRGYEFTVFMVGSGEMETELVSLVQNNAINNVVFGGFINQTDLPKVFATSDIFVLPAENEPWGLIVNEVMCASLPIIVSDEVGCVPDLVKDGINGYHIKAGDPLALTEALERILINPALRTSMGNQSLMIIKTWSYLQCKTGLLRALNMTVIKKH